MFGFLLGHGRPKSPAQDKRAELIALFKGMLHDYEPDVRIIKTYPHLREETARRMADRAIQLLRE
jgi:hypothetical protein